MLTSQLLLPLTGCWLLLPVGSWEPAPPRHHLRHHHEHHWGPHFEGHEEEDSTPRSLAVPLGGNASLDCKVAMLRDKTVAWLRRQADHVSLLTVGTNAYSPDPRYSVRVLYPNNWRLVISPVRRQDEGSYLCQVATHPPRLLAVNLTVIAPDVQIVDELGRSVRDRYYQTGSSIELLCRVVQPLNLPVRKVSWSKDGGPLPLGVAATDISEGESLSRMQVLFADKTHTGEYSCILAQDSEARVHIHVLNGETQAAVHHETWSAAYAAPRISTLWLLVLSAAVVAAGSS